MLKAEKVDDSEENDRTKQMENTKRLIAKISITIEISNLAITNEEHIY